MVEQAECVCRCCVNESMSTRPCPIRNGRTEMSETSARLLPREQNNTQYTNICWQVSIYTHMFMCCKTSSVHLHFVRVVHAVSHIEWYSCHVIMLTMNHNVVKFISNQRLNTPSYICPVHDLGDCTFIPPTFDVCSLFILVTAYLFMTFKTWLSKCISIYNILCS